MKKAEFLLNGLLVTTFLFLIPSKVSSMSQQVQDDIRHAMQTGNFRQGVQLGMMAGSMSIICFFASEGMILPGEGPLNVKVLNDISSKLLAKARSEFDDEFIPYHKAGVNLGIIECNKIFSEQLDYR
tara:strand:+ start:205 stop:585 length:381 start_codon:yes stop_codon:yes gene_type:complete